MSRSVTVARYAAVSSSATLPGEPASACANQKIGHVIGPGRCGRPRRPSHPPDRRAYPGSPASRRPPPPRGCIVPVRSTGMNAPFDLLCGATSGVGGTAPSVGSPSAEARVEQGPQHRCPSDPLGTWSRHGNPGDSRCLPSGSPLVSWPPWWPRPPWDPTTPHHPRRASPARCPRSRLSRRRQPRRSPPARVRVSRAPHAPRRPPGRTPPRWLPAGRPPRRPNLPPAGRRPRLAARPPPGP